MAWLERRGKRFRVVFRFQDQRFLAILKTTDAKKAEACLGRVEENLRLVERGRLTVPDGADLGLFLLSDGKLEQPVSLARTVRLAELFATYQSHFTAGAKEVITRAMEDIHMKHVTRLIGGETPLSAITAGTVQQFVDARSREEHNGHPVKPKTVRKAVATPPDTLWHGTSAEGFAAVLAEGLRPMGRAFVHLTTDPDYAAQVAATKGGGIMIRVAARAAANAGDEFYRAGRHVWLARAVAPAFVAAASRTDDMR